MRRFGSTRSCAVATESTFEFWAAAFSATFSELKHKYYIGGREWRRKWARCFLLASLVRDKYLVVDGNRSLMRRLVWKEAEIWYYLLLAFTAVPNGTLQSPTAKCALFDDNTSWRFGNCEQPVIAVANGHLTKEDGKECLLWCPHGTLSVLGCTAVHSCSAVYLRVFPIHMVSDCSCHHHSLCDTETCPFDT